MSAFICFYNFSFFTLRQPFGAFSPFLFLPLFFFPDAFQTYQKQPFFTYRRPPDDKTNNRKKAHFFLFSFLPSGRCTIKNIDFIFLSFFVFSFLFLYFTNFLQFVWYFTFLCTTTDTIQTTTKIDIFYHFFTNF